MTDEFDFIRYIKKYFILKGIGDDCAVLPKDAVSDLLVTADLLVEDVDFRLEWERPEDLGHKALAVSLSDIAAMGGMPVWAMLSMGIPENLWETDFVKRFYEGWNVLAAEFGVELIGGDISRSPDRFVVDSIAGGDVPKGKAILRSGARPGDGIFVSGSLGAAAGGLKLLGADAGLLDAKEDWQQRLLARQLRPMPRIELGKWLLANSIASTMIDLSDGLSSDLRHICDASGVGAELDAATVPVDDDLKHLVAPDETLLLALHGGEDFELLFTVSEEKISLLKNRDVSRVGIVTENAGVIRLSNGEQTTDLQPSGYRHF
jgi:thiamine-monophosphate kinase